MEKKIVYVDMDNVLVDFTSGIMKIDHDGDPRAIKKDKTELTTQENIERFKN
jgi:FMN phosphatase YigB (HAD superfamily)